MQIVDHADMSGILVFLRVGRFYVFPVPALKLLVNKFVKWFNTVKNFKLFPRIFLSKMCDNRYENFPPFKSTPKAVTQRRVVASKINILQ